VLGACLIEGSATVQRLARWLEPTDFETEANRQIYMSIVRVVERGDPVDMLIVQEELRGQNLRDLAGGPAPLALLEERGAIGAYVDMYAELVFASSRKRQLFQVGERAAVPLEQRNLGRGRRAGDPRRCRAAGASWCRRRVEDHDRHDQRDPDCGS